MSAALDVRKCFALASLFACDLPRLVASKASVIAERANIIRQSEASVGRSPSCAKMRRAKYRTQASVSAKKEKTRTKFVLIFLWCGLRKTNGAVAPRALHLTLRVLFVCYVRCARFLQMLCACSSLCLRSAETCSSAIVTEGQSRATDGVRPNNASIVACKLFDLQGEFKFGVRKKRKNTNKVRAYLFVVRSPRLELGRCNHTPLKRTRLPIPP